MANNTQRIREIREILRSGVKRVVVDGTVTEWDLDALRKELHDLLEEDQQQRSRRPRVSQINLGGF